MTRAAAVALIAASLACTRAHPTSVHSTDPDVPPQLARIVSQRCLRCHDGTGDSTLDLRRLPLHSDARTWLHMLEMVEGYRMPPPAHDGPVEQRFPLPAEERDAFLDSVTRMLGAAADPIVYARHLSLDHWLAIVSDVAAPALPADRVEAVIGEAMGAIKPFGLLETRGRVEPADRLVVENVSLAVCRAIAKAESARSAGERRVMVGLPADGAREVAPELTRPLVETLYRAVYQAAPAPDELGADQRLIAAIRTTTASWSEAWVGLCTAYLSSPHALYLYSGAP